MAAAEVNSNVRYEPEEVPPRPVFIGLGVQGWGVNTAARTLEQSAIAQVGDALGDFRWGSGLRFGEDEALDAEWVGDVLDGVGRFVLR